MNGKVVRDPDRWVDPHRDRVMFDGAPLATRPRTTWMLHKPGGYVTTRSDERGRPTVYDLMPADLDWLAPVGRLDLETSGLLLFTNDTELAHRITEPTTDLNKVYEVRCAGRLSPAQLDMLRRGVELDDGRTLPAAVDLLEADGDDTRIAMTIVEGRNRQIRRMLEAVGSEVLELHRRSIGPLHVAGLPVGRARVLTADELAALRRAVGDRRPRG